MKKNKNIPLNLREKSNSRIAFFCSVTVLVILVVLFLQLDYNLIQKPAETAKKEAAIKKAEAEKRANTPEVSTATVIAVGDNLYHGSLIESGQYESGTWNYEHIYENVKDEIQAADIAMIDQETVFTTDHSAVSSYPSFATPTEVGDALIKAGFDVIESATNHIDDFGPDYIEQTLDFWKTNYPEVPVLGIHSSQEDADTVKTLEVNGIKIAFLDYTYGTNNGDYVDGKDYMIDIFEKSEVASMIQKAKEDSDCLIFVAHWGKEDETMPTEYQKQWAAFLMEQGVDVVIGGHPHVLQPYGRMSDDNGNEMLIFYSLGNFVSTQQELPELLEGMAGFTIQKSVLKGKTTVEILDATVKPMVMHYNKDEGVFSPYMLEDYTEDLASQHGVRDIIGDEFTLDNLRKKFDEIMSMNVEPSTRTNLLEVSFDYELNMTDSKGNYVEDTWSVSSDQYYEQLGSSDNTSSDDTGEGSGENSDGGSDSYDNGSGDSSEGTEDDGYDDGSGDYDSGYEDEEA